MFDLMPLVNVLQQLCSLIEKGINVQIAMQDADLRLNLVNQVRQLALTNLQQLQQMQQQVSPQEPVVEEATETTTQE